MEELKDRLIHLRAHIQTKEFLKGKDPGTSRMDIHIFCYAPEDEMEVRSFTDQLENDPSLACRPRVIHLFRLFLDVCDSMYISEAIPDMEKIDGPEYLLAQLHSVISPQALVDAMHPDDCRPGDVVLLTGVGEAYPFISIHTLLEAMQPRFSGIPVLVLYPGEYDRYHTRLFNRLTPHDCPQAFRTL